MSKVDVSENNREPAPEPTLEITLASVLPTDRQPWWRTPHLIKLNLLLTAPILTGYLVGYDSSMLNGIQSVPIWNSDFGYPSGARLGLLSTMQTIGAVVSLPIAPFLTDHLGRRHPVAIGSIIALLGTALQSAAPNTEMFIAGRFFVGFGTGVVGNATPPLIAELAYPTHRIFVQAFAGTSWFLGAIVAAWSTYGTFQMDNSWSWRIPSLLQCIPSLYQLCLIYFVPESPRWLVSKGKISQARGILNKYHAGIDDDSDVSTLVRYEMAEIETAIELEKLQNTRSYLDFFATPGNRHRLAISIIIGVAAQWSGNGLISFYLVILLKSIGIEDPAQQNLINGGLTIFSYGMVIIGAFLVPRVRRRTLFLTGFMGMFFSYLIWTILSSIAQQKNYSDSSLSTGVVALIFVYNLFYNIGIGAVGGPYVMEVLTFTLRAKGWMIEQIFTYGTGVFNGFANPIAMEALGWRYYIVWVVMLAVWFIVAYFLFPETSGRTLEEVAVIFDGIDIGTSVSRQLEEKGDVGREEMAETV